MYYVPFENLDVMRRVPIYLNLETIYEKIVTHKRGGYCYEVNGLFQWLLEAVGFDTYLVGATVMRPTGEFAKKNTHVGIIVTLDDRKSTRLNSSHVAISYAVFCLKKKKKNNRTIITKDLRQ